MPRSEKPKPLGDVLDRLIDRLGLRDKIRETEAVETWAELAGPDINRRTESAWMRGDRLFVKITSPAWRHELHMSRKKWLEKLNDRLEEPFVEEIIFR